MSEIKVALFVSIIPREVRLLRHLEGIWHQMCFKVIQPGTETKPQINQDAVRLMKITLHRTAYADP